jgi:uncharacterized protein (DUF924 family)
MESGLVESPDSIIAFWFGNEIDDARIAAQKAKLWWSKNADTDLAIATRFEADVIAAADGDYDAWTSTPSGMLALILLTDQFPRNIYRGRSRSFAFDGLALHWALQGLEQGFDLQLQPIQRVFFYLPLEHSESVANQDRSLDLYQQLLNDVPEQQKDTFTGFRNFAIRHRDIVVQFGRFPHRNAILDRVSTDEEIAFLQTAGSSF